MSEQSISTVETNGANPVPDSERYGKSRDLFPVWFSWNISIFGITLGIYAFSFKLSVFQAILAGTIGYFVSCALVGILAVGSVRTGLPTMVQSRMAFGYHGNKIPSVCSWITNMGWKVFLVTMATTTMADVLQNFFPALSSGGDPSRNTILFSLAFVLLTTIIGAFYGYQLIMKVEKIIAWVTGLFTLIYLFFFIPQINFTSLSEAPSGSLGSFVGVVVFAMTAVGLGFLNYGGDYSRYLPRNTRAGGVVFWTMTGIALPVSVLLALGVMLSVGNPELLAKANREPLAAITSILPFWFYAPFSIVIIVSLVSAVMTGLYSSGLALLAAGIPLERTKATILNALIVSLGAYYVLFVSDSFSGPFMGFLSTISVIMGSWGAIEMVDLLRQRSLGWDVTHCLRANDGGKSVRWSALATLIFASVIGLGTISSADPNIAKVCGFLLSEEMKTSVFVTSNMGVVLAMIIAGLVYATLTLIIKIEEPKYTK